MKSWGNLYPQIYALENLYGAAARARKHKRRREDVERFELYRERFIGQLQQELITEQWRPSSYRVFTIHRPKPRCISAAPYRDRVVHHALCGVIGPRIERRFIDDTFSCRVGKGTSAGRERCRMFTNRYRYALKCDVRKYFDSIDHDVLLSQLARIIRCQPTLALCEKIIRAGASGTFAGSVRGLPIGNLTSQLFANLYLDSLDHYVREVLRSPGYVRYTDDFILWSDSKPFLKDCRVRIEDFMQGLRLDLHPGKTRVLPVSTGVPFLGFRFAPGLAPRLMGEGKRRFEKRMRQQCKRLRSGELDNETFDASVRGWRAFAAYGNVAGLYRTYALHGFG